jgi:hypothetical protein
LLRNAGYTITPVVQKKWFGYYVRLRLNGKKVGLNIRGMNLFYS